MKKKKFDPFKNLVLDRYEKEIEDALERNEYIPVESAAEVNKMWEEAAKNYSELRRTQRITLRVKNSDLLKVKVKAQKHNIPYQRLINALIHQFAEGLTHIVI